jgi:MFS family permease
MKQPLQSSIWSCPDLVVGAVACGFGAGMLNAATSTLVVTRSAELVRGRVIAALSGTARAASLLALLLGGLAGALLGPRATFVVAGSGCAVAAVVSAVLVIRAGGRWTKDSAQAVLSH